MNKWKTVLLPVILVVSMTGCGQKADKPVWTDDDFVFRTNEEEYTVPEKATLIVYPGQSLVMSHESEGYQVLEYSMETARGLKIGDDFETYKEIYGVGDAYGAWEMVDTENGTKMLDFHNQTPADIYGMGDVGAVWLDIAFAQKDGNWEPLEASQVRDIWFCEAAYEDYGRVALFSVFFRENGEVAGMGCYRIDYDESWKNWQNWENE